MKLTGAEFAQQCAFLAKNAAAWAGDALELTEFHHCDADPSMVARFLAEMRSRLDRIDERAGRRALTGGRDG
jgi:hypothetical protein